MDFRTYKACLEQISFGKRLPTATYVYCGEGLDLGSPLKELVEQLLNRYQIGPEFNVIKFRTDELKVSFLVYPLFFEEAHPALEKSITIDLATGRVRHMDYAGNPNPPILHRKETFLPIGHCSFAEFQCLTKEEEAAGLFENTSTIGFKLNWANLLKAKGVAIEGHHVIRRECLQGKKDEARSLIDRHKTAITRYELSKPVKTLLEYGVLKAGTSFFDYGCGQGSDIRGLQALGYEADGWDPIRQPAAPKKEADIVNLGYVLNVIENPAERLETLIDAHRHAKRLLVVSTLISGALNVQTTQQFRDGVLTKRNTFQKYFEQQELQQYLEDALEATAVPVALGVFYVFRDPVEQQDFMAARSRRSIDWTQISARLGLGRPQSLWKNLYEEHKEILDRFGELALQLGRMPAAEEFEDFTELGKRLGSAKRALRAFIQGGGSEGVDWVQIKFRFGIGQPPRRRWEILYDENKNLLDAYWRMTLQLGRTPEEHEFPLFSELLEKVGSANRAIKIFNQRGGADELKKAAENRRRDLLVYVALANLRKRVPFGHLSLSLRSDIRAFFNNYKRALEKGLELLYAAGDPGEIELACEDIKIGWQDEQALYFHRSLLDQLPPILRAYVGCATLLFGDAGQADVIKLHKSSGKVTFLMYDDFDANPLPVLHQRVKVNLRTRWVQVFDHSSERQVLQCKERFVFQSVSSPSNTKSSGSFHCQNV